MNEPSVVFIVAMAENRVIGRGNAMPWHVRSDLKRFKALTWGKPMIMGRKTFQSIGKPLPGRETVVLTRDPSFHEAGIHVANGWDAAVAMAKALAHRMDADAVAVAGGAEIYALALPHVDRMHLTQVHTAPQGDAVFPSFDRSAFRELARRDHPAGPDAEHPFTFIDLERRSTAASR
jgi:dihydrofolate reductase